MKKLFLFFVMLVAVFSMAQKAKAVTADELAAQSQALDQNFYPTVTLFKASNLTFSVTPFEFDRESNRWNYRVEWNRLANRSGSVYINGNIFQDYASGSGKNYTGYNLAPGGKYLMTYYSFPSGKGVRIASRYFKVMPAPPVPVTPRSNPTFSFEPNGGAVVIERDHWTFALLDGQVGDELAVDAWLDNAPKGRMPICTVVNTNSGFADTTCSLSKIPTRNEIGMWREDVFINDINKGSVNFTVSPREGVVPDEPGFAFYVDGQPATSAQCGSAYSFGPTQFSRSQIWISMTKNGEPYFEGATTTLNSFVTQCSVPGKVIGDEGIYTIAAYELDGGAQGDYIGLTSLNITKTAAKPLVYIIPKIGPPIPTNIVMCGQTYGMRVDNYKGDKVILSETKNGAGFFNGVLKIPSTPYITTCGRDEGVYIASFTSIGLGSEDLGGFSFVVY